jgi:hypothetical protein
LRAVKELVPAGANVQVRRADRPYSEAEGATGRIQKRLIFDGPDPDVIGVGPLVADGQFVVSVDLYPYGHAAAERVRALAAADEVLVRARTGVPRLA